VRGPANPFTNTTPALVAAQTDTLRPTPKEAPWREPRHAASTVAVVALVALGILGPALVLRVRRLTAPTDPLPSTGGLYRDTVR
jgi:hypothetical protein